MTTWAISVADTFLNELLNLPNSVSKRVSKVIKVLQSDPISANGDAKKIKGYANNVYRVRIGNYRLFYSFGQGWVKLLSIRKRDDRTYEIEIPDFEAPAPPPDENVLDPQILESEEAETPSTSLPKEQPHPSTPETSQEITTALPFNLTESLLKQWQIPSDYWGDILQVQNSEALLELPIPDRWLSRIVDNLYPRPIEEIAVQREYVLQQPEDLDRFVEGRLSDFLLKLSPEQEKLKEFGKKGPVLVKGGPGTGKSTLAIYRVQKLLDLGFKPILFTTYTKALVAYSEQLLEQLLQKHPAEAGVTVSTVDSLTFQYYRQAYGHPGFAKPEQIFSCLETALKTTDIPAKNSFDRQVRRQSLDRLGLPYLLQEFSDVIDAWGISNQEDYLSIERRGRGVPLKANLREAIWAVYQAWKCIMAEKGYITWDQLRLKALEVVQQLPDAPYQSVVIDEAQDLSPTSLRFLLALTPSLDGVYLTADASQSLYQRGFSWKQVHVDLHVTGRTLILKRNYRNTEQIAAACASILDGTEAGDTDCLIQEPSPYQGSLPSVVLTDSPEQELQLIQEFLSQSAKQFRLPIHGGAVLCPTIHAGQAIAKRFNEHGLAAKFVAGDKIDINAPYIKVLTLHSAKGLEFPFVVIIGLQDGQFPYFGADTPSDEIPVVTDEQRRLFYVGCSRAMRSLMVCCSRSRPSQFLESLTPPAWKR